MNENVRIVCQWVAAAAVVGCVVAVIGGTIAFLCGASVETGAAWGASAGVALVACVAGLIGVFAHIQ